MNEIKKRNIVAIISAVCVLVWLLMIGLTGCGNQQFFDTIYTYDRAILALPNGDVIEGKVDSWRDYDNSDQIQVKINGVTYLVHSVDVVLIQNKK
jgi:hypothetical protein